MTRIKFKVTIISLIFIILAALQPITTIASPSSKRAQLSQLKNEVDQIDQSIEIVDEEYNQASNKLAKIQKKVELNTASIAKTRARLAFSQGVLGKRIRAMYMQNTDTSVEFILSTRSFNEMLTNWNFIDRIGQTDAGLVKKVFRLKKQFEVTRKNLKQNLAYQNSLVNTIASKKSKIKAQLNHKKNLISGLEADLQAYQAAEERRQAELAARSIQEEPSQMIRDISISPPTNAPRSEVVNIAMRYLGVPYRWGGASPASGFDCSGFSMYVYAQVGVSLPHFAAAQFNVGQKVPRGSLEPGDLVFFGSPIHHMGIYIGGGMMINATHSGDVVRVQPAFRGDYVGASRP